MSNQITFEEFINQHDGLCLIMEKYDLDADKLQAIFSKGLSDYLFNKTMDNWEEDYYCKQTEQGYYGK